MLLFFSTHIVNATCVLHNIAKQYNVADVEIYLDDEDINEENIGIDNVSQNMRAREHATRRAIIERYFT